MIDNAVELLNVVITGATIIEPRRDNNPFKRLPSGKPYVDSTATEEEGKAAPIKRGRPPKVQRVPNPKELIMGILEANPDTHFSSAAMDAALRAKGTPMPMEQITKTLSNMRKNSLIKVKFGRGQAGRGRPQEYKLAA